MPAQTDVCAARALLAQKMDALLGYFNGERYEPPVGFETREEAGSFIQSVIKGIENKGLADDPIAALVKRAEAYARNVYVSNGGTKYGFLSEAKEVNDDLRRQARQAGIDLSTVYGGPTAG